jgi:hypothetical protein
VAKSDLKPATSSTGKLMYEVNNLMFYWCTLCALATDGKFLVTTKAGADKHLTMAELSRCGSSNSHI